MCIVRRLNKMCRWACAVLRCSHPCLHLVCGMYGKDTTISVPVQQAITGIRGESFVEISLLTLFIDKIGTMRLFATLAVASKYLALTGICVLAFSIRLFSIIKYESVIHEFDPYFNYRVTQFLTKEGFYEMWNWFDDRTWYPLGRVIGGTIYPVGICLFSCLQHCALRDLLSCKIIPMKAVCLTCMHDSFSYSMNM